MPHGPRRHQLVASGFRGKWGFGCGLGSDAIRWRRQRWGRRGPGRRSRCLRGEVWVDRAGIGAGLAGGVVPRGSSSSPASLRRHDPPSRRGTGGPTRAGRRAPAGSRRCPRSPRRTSRPVPPAGPAAAPRARGCAISTRSSRTGRPWPTGTSR